MPVCVTLYEQTITLLACSRIHARTMVDASCRLPGVRGRSSQSVYSIVVSTPLYAMPIQRPFKQNGQQARPHMQAAQGSPSAGAARACPGCSLAAFVKGAADFAGLRTLMLVAPGPAPTPEPAWASNDSGGPGRGSWDSPSQQRTEADYGWCALTNSSSSSSSALTSTGSGGGDVRHGWRSPARAVTRSPAQVWHWLGATPAPLKSLFLNGRDTGSFLSSAGQRAALYRFSWSC